MNFAKDQQVTVTYSSEGHQSMSYSCSSDSRAVPNSNIEHELRGYVHSWTGTIEVTALDGEGNKAKGLITIAEPGKLKYFLILKISRKTSVRSIDRIHFSLYVYPLGLF